LFGLRADKTDRPADDHFPPHTPELLFDGVVNVSQDACNQLLHLEALAEYFGGLQAAAGEKGFQRLHEAAFLIRAQILLDSGRAAPGFDDAAAIFPDTLQIEQGTE